MRTLITENDIKRAAEMIRNGGLVAVPTETVYGLAGSGLNEAAVHKIYEVKGRPEVKPLSLMVAGPEDIDRYCHNIPEAAYALAEKYWPGPLTIVLPAKEVVPEIVRAGGSTVGLRCPAHPLTLELIREAGLPLAAPSANPSGAPSPKTAQEVCAYFDGAIDAIIDGGACTLGTESTIMDMSRMPFRILRQGALPEAELRTFLRKTVFTLGLAGGTGCGKTTALNVLKEMNFKIIDADEVYHQMLQDDVPMIEEMKASFPEAFPESGFDRKALGAIVFADSEKLLLLNAITHKHICRRIDGILEEHAINGGRFAAIDAVELFTSGLSERCRKTIGVIAEDSIRIARIMQRDSISFEYAQSRVQAQKPNAYYVSMCDYVLTNNSTQQEFYDNCKLKFKEIVNNG